MPADDPDGPGRRGDGGERPLHGGFSMQRLHFHGQPAIPWREWRQFLGGYCRGRRGLRHSQPDGGPIRAGADGQHPDALCPGHLRLSQCGLWRPDAFDDGLASVRGRALRPGHRDEQRDGLELCGFHPNRHGLPGCHAGELGRLAPGRRVPGQPVCRLRRRRKQRRQRDRGHCRRAAGECQQRAGGYPR